MARASEALTIAPSARNRFGEVAEAARIQLAVAPATAAARFE